MGGKNGSAPTLHKRNKKKPSQVQSGGSFSKSKKQTPCRGQFISLEDELAAIGLRVTTVRHHKDTMERDAIWSVMNLEAQVSQVFSGVLRRSNMSQQCRCWLMGTASSGLSPTRC